MRYFPISSYIKDQRFEGILKLNQQSTNLIIEICKNLKIPLQGLHLALWLFHCQVKLLTYHKFNRFIYICGCILVATKIGQHLRNPIDILHQMRNILRRRKNLHSQDSEQFIKKYLKKIFQAEINIMINIGFDFDIFIAIQYLNQKLKQQIRDPDLIDKLKQTLTSLYKTQTVIYYQSQLIAITALDIVMKNQGLNIELSKFSDNLVKKLKNQKIKQVKSFFVNNCTFQ